MFEKRTFLEVTVASELALSPSACRSRSLPPPPPTPLFPVDASEVRARHRPWSAAQEERAGTLRSPGSGPHCFSQGLTAATSRSDGACEERTVGLLSQGSNSDGYRHGAADAVVSRPPSREDRRVLYELEEHQHGGGMARDGYTRAAYDKSSMASRARGPRPSSGSGSTETSAAAPPGEEEQAVASEITTLMIRNLPCRIMEDELQVALASIGLGDRYDFLYLPRAHRKVSNLGYAFVNCLTPEDAATLSERFAGYRFHGIASDKVCTVRPARIQGLRANVERLHVPPIAVSWQGRRLWVASAVAGAGGA